MAQSSTLATAADYADAMITARRAKTWLLVILLVMLLAQLAIFFAAKYTNGVVPRVPDATIAASTQPAAVARINDPEPLALVLEYAIGLTTFLGIALVIVLAIVLLLLVIIMLVGRLIGVSKVTSAFIWCAILAVLLFPWQAFLNYPTLADAEFRVPGVLYTWAELVRDVHFEGRDGAQQFLKWARFVGFPIVAIIILLMIQVKSNRGLKLALGEAEPPYDAMGTTNDALPPA